MNQAMIVGNLGQDPEVRQTQSGKTVATLRVATQDGRDEVNWHNVVVWDAQGQACGQYLRKGSKVAVLGRIKYRSWERDGVTKYATDIVAFRVEFMDPAGGERRPQHTTRDYDGPPGRAPYQEPSRGQGGGGDGYPY